MKINKDTSNWAAWYNLMSNPHTLHVTGQIDVGNNSDGAELVFDSIEESNPPNLVLKIAHKTIFVPRPPGDNIVYLHYSEEVHEDSYNSIKIKLDGEVIKEFSKCEIGTAH